MSLTYTDEFGNTVSVKELINYISDNMRMCVRSVYVAKNHLDNEIYDSEYNEFGNPREYSYPSSSIYEAKEAYQKELDDLREFAQSAAEVATFPSFDVANELANTLNGENSADSFSVRTETIDGLEYLLVTDGKDITHIIDIDGRIGESSKRNMFDDEKLIDGKSYSLYSFIPEEYKSIYRIYKKEISETA